MKKVPRYDIVVIGGGISGTAATYELAGTGASVLLIEKGSLASMASGWTLAGVRQSGRHVAELPLAQAAVCRWERLGQELEADVEYRQEGNLRLARTPEEVAVIASLVEEQRTYGLDLAFLPDNAAVRAVAPAISESVLAASYCPTDGHANPVKTVQAFAAAAERRGATIQTQTRVTDIKVQGGRIGGVQTTAGPLACDVVVIAAGVYSDRLCALAGLELPLTVTHVTVVQTVPLPPLLRPVLGVANADFAGRQEVNGRLRITGGVEPWQWPSGELGAETVQPPAHAVATVIQRGIALLPALTHARIAQVWGGLIDMTPDALPVIERALEVEGLIVAAGFSGHGFCLGPITGQLICELVMGKATSLPIDPFKRERFASLKDRAKTELHG